MFGIPCSNIFESLSQDSSLYNEDCQHESSNSQHTSKSMLPLDNVTTYFPKKGKVIAHLNIQSILPKIEELRFHVDQSNIKILSINETFLDQTINDCEIGIPGFDLFRNDLSRTGGGSLLYTTNVKNMHMFVRACHLVI